MYTECSCKHLSLCQHPLVRAADLSGLFCSFRDNSHGDWSRCFLDNHILLTSFFFSFLSHWSLSSSNLHLLFSLCQPALKHFFLNHFQISAFKLFSHCSFFLIFSYLPLHFDLSQSSVCQMAQSICVPLRLDSYPCFTPLYSVAPAQMMSHRSVSCTHTIIYCHLVDH